MTEAYMQSAFDESLAASLYPFSDILTQVKIVEKVARDGVLIDRFNQSNDVVGLKKWQSGQKIVSEDFFGAFVRVLFSGHDV